MTDKIQEEGLEAIALGTKQSQFEAIRKQNQEQYAASGFVHFGKHVSRPPAITSVNEGLWTYINSSFANMLTLGRTQDYAKYGKSKFEFPIINIAGVIFDLSDFSAVGETAIKFPSAPDGTVTYDKSNGEVKKHINSATAFDYASLDLANREVVTDRVDMWGFEAFLEEVTKSNPFVYPNGLIQSQATAMDGITTTSGTRPVTYYAVFDGDTTSVGKGLDFFALSEENRKKVVSNSKHNLYYLDDGRLVQWRLRQRTIAGAGNGDWQYVSSVGIPFAYPNSTLSFVEGQDGRGQTRVKPQGNRITPSSGVSLGSYADSENVIDYMNPNASVGISTPSKDSGVWSIRGAYPENFAVNGECYFLVCGTVNRLNQGAYHPSFNPSGAKGFGSTTDAGATAKWYVSSALPCASTHDCFSNASIAPTAGSIAGGASRTGRPDARYYDAIYADGQGGVCRDMRYSANGVDLVDFDEADLRVKNGTYRGFEKLKFTIPKAGGTVTKIGTYQGGSFIEVSNFPIISKGVRDKRFAVVYNATKNQVCYVAYIHPHGELYLTTSKTCQVLPNGGGSEVDGRTIDPYTGSQVGDIIYLLDTFELPSSVGGSFLQTDVIGDPAKILQVDALKDGWLGSWIPVVPNGVVQYKQFPFTRKSLIAGINSAPYTDNLGVSWTPGGPPIDTVINAVNSVGVVPATLVQLLPYQAFAKQTEPADNAEVYGGKRGLGDVLTGMNHDKAYSSLLGESLVSNVLKDTASSLANRTETVSRYSIFTNDKLNSLEHTQTSLVAPANNSHAFKALDYNVNLNQQAFKQYAATELKHDGTDWGDDGKVTIVNGESTKTDLNGNVVKVVTHKLKEPIGWIKNEV